MLDKLRNFYSYILYKLSLFSTFVLNLVMLHLIKVNKLDPSSDPEELKFSKFKEDLNKVFTYPEVQHTKISVGTGPQSFYFKNKTKPGDVPDYSERGNQYKPPSVSEVVNGLLKKYNPQLETLTTPKLQVSTTPNEKTNLADTLKDVAKIINNPENMKELYTVKDQEILIKLNEMASKVKLSKMAEDVDLIVSEELLPEDEAIVKEVKKHLSLDVKSKKKSTKKPSKKPVKKPLKKKLKK